MSPAYLRVVQSLKNFMPPKTIASLTQDQFETIHEAVRRYYRAVEGGVTNARAVEATGQELLKAYNDVGFKARGEVEDVLIGAFMDRAVVSRLTTEIIRNCR